MNMSASSTSVINTSQPLQSNGIKVALVYSGSRITAAMRPVEAESLRNGVQFVIDPSKSLAAILDEAISRVATDQLQSEDAMLCIQGSLEALTKEVGGRWRAVRRPPGRSDALDAEPGCAQTIGTLKHGIFLDLRTSPVRDCKDLISMLRLDIDSQRRALVAMKTIELYKVPVAWMARASREPMV